MALNSSTFFDPNAKPDAARARRDPEYRRRLIEESGRDKGLNVKKTKIDPKKVFNRGSQTQPDSTKKKTQSADVGGSNAIVKYIENNEKAITTLSNVVVNDSEEEKKQQKEKEARTVRQQETDSLKKEEGALEKFKNIGKKALLAPVKAVGNAVKGMLSKLMDAFALLFTGWIVDKGMKFIEAWQSGDKDKMKEIGVNIIGGLGIVGGIVLAFNVGLMALPGLLATLATSIVSIGGAILGFLISPPGLIALAIAAGVGGIILGGNAIRNKITGGKAFSKKHDELDQRLRDAGMTAKGIIKDGMHDVERTEEQEKIFQEVEAERKRIKDLKKNMNAELDEVPASVPKTGSSGGQGGRKKKVHSKADKEIIKQKKDEIRLKYQGMLSGNTADSSSVTPPSTEAKIDKSTSTANIDELKDPDPKVIVKPSQKKESGKVPLTSGTTTEVPSIASSDPNNFYTMYSKMQYNVVG